MRSRLTRSLLVLLAAAALPLAAQPTRSETAITPFLQGVRKSVLPNGLTVLIRPQPGSGVVAINTWVKAGYFHEPDEVAGMAHLFEHMFFKGSKKFPGAEQISQELSSVGGTTNAGTIYDSTNYYFVLPKEGFRRGVEIQADAIMNPLFDPEELRKEAEVVIEESNRKLDNPPAVALERMFATSFTEHRMKRWRIGSNEVLRNIQRDDLLRFFETLYRPENIIVSVAGDVTHEEALAAIRSTFGKLPRGKLVKRGGPREPEQKEFRYGQSAADIRQAYSVFGWQTAGAGHADELALDLLSDVLGTGRSSRLYRNAIGPAAASTANANHYTFEDVGIFFVQASFDEKNRAEVDRRVVQEIERIRSSGPTLYELELAKNRIEASLLLGLETVLAQSRSLASYEARGSYRDMEQRLVRLRSMTPAELQRVATKYLTVDKLTLYHYRPASAPEMTREQALAVVRQAMETVPPAIAEVPIPAALAPVKGAAREKPVHQVTLDNGATLLVKERPGAPIVTTSIYFPGGRVDENSSIAGITQLMTRAMRRGTSSRSAEEINQQIEFLGTQIGTIVREDYFGFSITIPQTSYRGGLQILSDIVLHPTFPDEDVREERHLQLAAIRRSLDSSASRAQQLAESALFGNHPYALPADGFPGSLQHLDSAALRNWWSSQVAGEGALIVVVGDIATADAVSAVTAAFDGLPGRTIERKVTAPEPPSARVALTEYRDRKQSAIMIAFPTVTPSHPDWPALRMLQNVTSGLAGTFFAELRGRRSLAYTVYARDSARVQGGSFVAYLASDSAKEEEARTALLEEIRKLSGEGVREDDVERAKRHFAGVTRIRLQTNSALASELVWNHFFGVGHDFTERLLARTGELQADDLRAAAKKYLSGEQFATGMMSGNLQ
jgi:zinc protease